jgi:Arc/MetJ family transcription regulator
MGTRINIVVDDDVIAEAMARAGVTTKKAAVEAALRAYVRKPDYSGLLALAGGGVIADDYDPKSLFRSVPTTSR